MASLFETESRRQQAKSTREVELEARVASLESENRSLRAGHAGKSAREAELEARVASLESEIRNLKAGQGGMEARHSKAAAPSSVADKPTALSGTEVMALIKTAQSADHAQAMAQHSKFAESTYQLAFHELPVFYQVRKPSSPHPKYASPRTHTVKCAPLPGPRDPRRPREPQLADSHAHGALLVSGLAGPIHHRQLRHPHHLGGRVARCC